MVLIGVKRALTGVNMVFIGVNRFLTGLNTATGVFTSTTRLTGSGKNDVLIQYQKR